MFYIDCFFRYQISWEIVEYEQLMVYYCRIQYYTHWEGRWTRLDCPIVRYVGLSAAGEISGPLGRAVSILLFMGL